MRLFRHSLRAQGDRLAHVHERRTRLRAAPFRQLGWESSPLSRTVSLPCNIKCFRILAICVQLQPGSCIAVVCQFHRFEQCCQRVSTHALLYTKIFLLPYEVYAGVISGMQKHCYAILNEIVPNSSVHRYSFDAKVMRKVSLEICI